MAEKEYYLIINDSQKGPFALEELGNYGIERSTRVFRLGATGFVNAEEIKEIKDLYFSASRVYTKPEINTPSPRDTDAPSINMKSLGEAARRERERRRQIEEAQRRGEETSFSFHGTNTAGGFPPPAPEIPVAPPVEPKEWYLIDNGLQQGPVSLTELKSYPLTDQTTVWRAGMAEWQPASSVPEIAPFVAPVPAPIPSPVSVTAPPPISAAAVVETSMVSDTSAEDARAYGSPNIVPIAGLILSLLDIAAIAYFGAELLGFEFDINVVVASLVLGGVPLLLSLAGIVNASSARRLYFSNRIKRACKKSGAATAYGWASVIIALGMAIIMVLTAIFVQ